MATRRLRRSGAPGAVRDDRDARAVCIGARRSSRLPLSREEPPFPADPCAGPTAPFSFGADALLSVRSRGRGETVGPDLRLRFGETADLWFAGPVLDLRPATQAGYRSAVEHHLKPRFGTHRLDTITADDLAMLVRDMRDRGKSEATIAAVLGAASRIYKFAADGSTSPD
jgi:Phage integrase, N-terminal SAM-like domain